MTFTTLPISKRTLALILSLGAFTIFFLVLAIQTPPPPQTKITIVPTPTPYAQSILSFEPTIPSTQSASSLTKMINVAIDTAINPVTVVQLDIGYDPKVITVTDITQGTFFPNAIQLVKDIDTTNGRISYALGLAPHAAGVKGKGTIAIVSYTVVPYATASATQLIFLPKTQVAALGIGQSVLKLAPALTIPLLFPSPSIVIPTRSVPYNQLISPTVTPK